MRMLFAVSRICRPCSPRLFLQSPAFPTPCSTCNPKTFFHLLRQHHHHAAAGGTVGGAQLREDARQHGDVSCGLPVSQHDGVAGLVAGAAALDVALMHLEHVLQGQGATTSTKASWVCPCM